MRGKMLKLTSVPGILPMCCVLLPRFGSVDFGWLLAGVRMVGFEVTLPPVLRSRHLNAWTVVAEVLIGVMQFDRLVI